MAAVAGALTARTENVPVVILALTPAPLPGTTKIVPVPPCKKANVPAAKAQLNAPTCTPLGSKPPDSLIGPSAAPLAVPGMLNAVSVWLVPLPVLVSISLETKAVTLFAPSVAEVQAPANPSAGAAARTAGCPLEFLCSVTIKVLGCGGGGTSLGRLSALRPERASASLDSLPRLPRERAWPS